MTSLNTHRTGWAPGLAAAVRLAEEILRGRADGLPSVPSAGAIHPCELLVLGTGDVLLRLDPARRLGRRVPVDAAWFAGVRDAGLTDDGPRHAHLLVLVRPWLTMRKYGLRGHEYALLDAAHLATAVLGAALADGMRATLRLSIPRPALRDLLGPAARFRDLHSVVSLDASAAGDDTGWRPWSVADEPEAHPPIGEPADRPSLVTELEGICWSRIPDLPHPASSRRASRPLVTVAGAPVEPPHLLPAWPALARRRRSSGSFGTRPLTAATVARIAAAAALPLPTDLADRAERITLVTHRAATADDATHRRIVDACRGQRNLADADTFLLFRATRDERIPRTELLLRAGAAAHLVYLAATAAGVAVTAIGGFDPAEWAAIAGLPDSDDVVYLMAIGRPGAASVKFDRNSTPQWTDR